MVEWTEWEWETIQGKELQVASLMKDPLGQYTVLTASDFSLIL